MFQYVPTFMPNKVMIIGGGGTGSRLVPLLAQFLKTAAWIQNPEITIVDDDVVEEKNLLRQNFISIDVGKPKAEVLAQRYSRAFNIPITPVVKRVKPAPGRYATVSAEESADIAAQRELFMRYSNNAIVVMCVDSPAARRHIVGQLLGTMPGSGNVLLIDSGNENDFGQIKLSTCRHVDLGGTAGTLEMWKGKMMGDQTIPLIPIDMDYYHDMRAETTLSCADLDQTMAINTMMAVTMFGIIQNFVYAKPIGFHRLNVSLSHGVTPEYMNPQFISRVKSKTGYYTAAADVEKEFGRQGYEFSVASVGVAKEVLVFHETTMLPAIIAMEKAEKDAEAKALVYKAKEELKLKDKAVEEAMKLYGWTKPEEKKAPKAKEELADILQKDFEDGIKQPSGGMVKRVRRKGVEAREKVIDDIAAVFGIKDESWEV